jgi:hypothetical protein
MSGLLHRAEMIHAEQKARDLWWRMLRNPPLDADGLRPVLTDGVRAIKMGERRKLIDSQAELLRLRETGRAK